MTRKPKPLASPDSPSTGKSRFKGLYKRLLVQTGGDEAKAKKIWKKRIKEIDEELDHLEERSSSGHRGDDL